MPHYTGQKTRGETHAWFCAQKKRKLDMRSFTRSSRNIEGYMIASLGALSCPREDQSPPGAALISEPCRESKPPYECQ